MAAVLRGHVDQLKKLLDADPNLIHQRFAELDFGTTAARGLTLRGCTLLHVAVEFVTDALWRKEVEDRIQAYNAGSLKSLSLDEVLSKYAYCLLAF